MYHCRRCRSIGFDLCETCHGQGLTCPKDGHYLVKTSDMLEIEIEAAPTDIRNYVEWRIDSEPKLLNCISKQKDSRKIASTLVQQARGMYVKMSQSRYREFLSRA